MTGSLPCTWLFLGTTAMACVVCFSGASDAAAQAGKPTTRQRPGTAGAASTPPDTLGTLRGTSGDDFMPGTANSTAGPGQVALGSDAGDVEFQSEATGDGYLSYPAEPQTPIDGVIPDGEVPLTSDGHDVTADTRTNAERGLFENPPAGYDPLLFQIEDIATELDRRPGRLFRLEPYDPVGIRVGSFVLFPELATAGVWTSNVLSSPDRQADTSVEVLPSGRLVSNWSVHALEFNAGSTLSFHDDFSSEDDRAYRIEARGRLDVTRRTNLQGILARDLAQESRSAIDASNAPERTDVFTDAAALTLNHRFNRLSLRLRGSFTERDFADDKFGSQIVRNGDRDVEEWEEALRATYEFKPSLGLFAETSFDQRTFKAPAQSDNIRRDSNGQRYRVGLDFGDTGRVLRGEVSIGYGVEEPESRLLDKVETLLFDANVAWRASELTTLLLTAASGIEETTAAGSAGVTSQTAALEVRHAFRRHLVASAGIAYLTRDFDGTAIDENEWRTTLGVEYFLNPELVMFGDFAHVDFESDGGAGSFRSDDIRIGLRMRR